MWELKSNKANRQEVYESYRQARDARLRERVYCVLLAYDGLNPGEISAILGRDLGTVRLWLQLFNDGGLQGVRKPMPRPAKTTAKTAARRALGALDPVSLVPETT